MHAVLIPLLAARLGRRSEESFTLYIYIYGTEYLFVVWLKFKVYFINDKLSIYHVDVGNLVTFAALGGMCNLVLVQQ